MSVELVNLDKTKIMAMKWKYNHSGWRNFTEWDEGLKTIMEQETSIICQPLNMQRVATDATHGGIMFKHKISSGVLLILKGILLTS